MRFEVTPGSRQQEDVMQAPMTELMSSRQSAGVATEGGTACCYFAALILSVMMLSALGHAETGSEAAAATTDPASVVASTSMVVTTDGELPVVRDSVDVVAERPVAPAITTIDTHALRSTSPLGDGAEVLRAQPGLSLGRMGGHGLEPAIRGLSQSNLNVLLDGAYIHGGCPNRMDPQTSFAAAESYDEVVVIRGVQTLRYGGGGTGGTVLYQRHAPVLGDTLGWRVDASLGGGSFLDGPDGSLDLSVGTDRWSLRLLGSVRDQGNYEDGDGREVRSAFSSAAATVLFGWSFTDVARLEASFERTSTDDALFAGAGMDAPEDESSIYRVRAYGDPGTGRGPRWSASVYHDTVDHLMDNYSLRQLAAPMAMRVPSSSDTTGGRAILEWERPQWLIGVGIDHQRNERDATRFAGPSPERVSMAQSFMWADALTQNSGAFAEGTVQVGLGVRVTGGLRVDRWESEARGAERRTMGGDGPSPRQLWSLYYPDVTPDWDDTVIGGLARVEWSVWGGTLFGSVSRSSRGADATERFLGANSSNAPMRWVGNPTLDVAKHNQVEVGFDWSTDGGAIQASLFADSIDDYILRDRAHGQEGILRDDRAFVYRNVDATRIGGELAGMARLTDRLLLSGNVSYVEVENTTDDRPVAQIPPLEGRLALAYGAPGWSLSAAVRAAAEQTRVDDDPMVGSGLDAGETAGWSVLDLSGTATVGGGFELMVGVDNVLDRTYATHLNRSSLFEPVPVQVNEPGRSLWVRVRWAGGR